MVILLYFFFSPLLSPFHLGERAYEKRSNILAEILMVLEIELWTIDPHIPGPKMRPPSRILGCPRSCFQELDSWQTLPFRTQSITARKGISPFSCHPPRFHLQPEEPVLTEFRKRELCWVNVGSWNNQEPYCSEFASLEVGSNLTSPPTHCPAPHPPISKWQLGNLDAGDGRNSFRTLASMVVPLCCWKAPKFIHVYGDFQCWAAVDRSV